MKRARGAHIVIRGLGWKQRERIVDQKWLRVGLCIQPVLSGVQLPATVGTHSLLARSLASRPFAREFYLYHHVPGRPASRRSFARSLVYLRSVVVSAPVFQDRVCSEGSRVPRKKPWVYLYERSHKSRRSSSVSRLTLVGYGSRSTGYDPYCRVYPLRGPV